MRKKNLGAIAIKGFALLVVLATGYQAMAQDATAAYPNMAPIEQYLMDRTAEMALARSAAPESISRDAEILVLGRHGFETAGQGTNGCAEFPHRWCKRHPSASDYVRDCRATLVRWNGISLIRKLSKIR